MSNIDKALGAYRTLTSDAGLPAKLPGSPEALNSALDRISSAHAEAVEVVRGLVDAGGYEQLSRAMQSGLQNPSALGDYSAKKMAGVSSMTGSQGVDPSQIAAKIDPPGKVDGGLPGSGSKVLLIGPPASGKGTQAKLLETKLGLEQISTGDMLRQAAKDGTKLGVEAKTYMDAGLLVPDALIIGLIQARLMGEGPGAGWALDGFPRTLGQAKALQSMLGEIGVQIDRVFVLDVPEGLIIERMTGRRSCEDCGTPFHVEFSPPKVEGCCDECDGKLMQRDDDTEDKVRVRIKQFESQTADVIPFYESRGLITRINAAGKPDRAFAGIQRALTPEAS